MKIVCSNCGSTGKGKFCPDCGHALSAATPSAVDTDDTVKVLAKTLGVQEFVQIILSVHAPIRRIRSLLASGSSVLSRVVTAYIELVTIIPFLHKEVLLRLGQAVDFPLIVQGTILETSILFYLFAAIGGAVGLAIIYVLPKRLFEPTNQPELLAVNLQLSMYTVLYVFIADLLKMMVWASTDSFSLVAVLGWAVIIAVTVLTIYVWRRLLTLSWLAIVLLLVIGGVVAFVQGLILGFTGLLHF